MPKIIIADAGYSSEENYLYCMDNSYIDLIPFNTMRFEMTNRYKKDIKYWQHWEYDEQYDRFICPNGKNIEFKNYSTKKDKYGYQRDFKIYECESCDDCEFKDRCTKSKGNRKIQYNPIYEEIKSNVKNKLLNSEKYQEIYSKRKIEPETVFGNLKANLSFTKFHLRGNEKVKIEFGLIAMAHNLIKIWLDRAKLTYTKLIKRAQIKIHATHSFPCKENVGVYFV